MCNPIGVAYSSVLQGIWVKVYIIIRLYWKITAQYTCTSNITLYWIYCYSNYLILVCKTFLIFFPRLYSLKVYGNTIFGIIQQNITIVSDMYQYQLLIFHIMQCRWYIIDLHTRISCINMCNHASMDISVLNESNVWPWFYELYVIFPDMGIRGWDANMYEYMCLIIRYNVFPPICVGFVLCLL